MLLERKANNILSKLIQNSREMGFLHKSDLGYGTKYVLWKWKLKFFYLMQKIADHISCEIYILFFSSYELIFYYVKLYVHDWHKGDSILILYFFYYNMRTKVIFIIPYS